MLESDEALADESEATDTVQCGSPLCDREVYEPATVDVVAGATVGEWNDPEPHLGVTGVDGGSPVVEQWCINCAETEFGLTSSAFGRRVEKATYYVNAATVSAFLLGVALTVLLVLLV